MYVYQSLNIIGPIVETVCEIQAEAANDFNQALSMIESTEYQHLGNVDC
jgi:hypothetical protein